MACAVFSIKTSVGQEIKEDDQRDQTSAVMSRIAVCIQEWYSCNGCYEVLMKRILSSITNLFRISLSVALAGVIVISGLMLCCQVGLTSVRGHGAKAKSCCHLSLAHQIKGK